MRSLRDALQPTSPAASVESVKSTRLRAPNVDLLAAAEGLGRWYESQHMKVQIMPVGNTHVVQARSSSQWKRALGMAVALTVTMRQDGVDLVVEIGKAPWMAKSAAAVMWSAALPPLMVAPVLGLANQARLPGQTIDFLKATLPHYLPAQHPPVEPSPPPHVAPPRMPLPPPHTPPPRRFEPPPPYAAPPPSRSEPPPASPPPGQEPHPGRRLD
ncbi:hypothetical protein [Streptomyces sp. NPDC047000]|uniref:hypothetical protein n=1 Tax=Streptomyces sp. NPDC047000 TaxID=3155474 RepID=UPI0033C21C68